jgi:CheY-like chemotaxis protein
MSTRAGLRILVVEDNHEAAASLATFLEMSGHEVQVAPDGRSALHTVAAVDPDVVLIDIGLPDLDGYQVARSISERPAARRPLLVAITGYGQKEDYRRSHEAGMDLHLVKPADPQALRQLLRRFEDILGGGRESAPPA